MKRQRLLAGLEDFALGDSPIKQRRNGVDVTITPLNLIWPITSIEELKELDTRKIKHAQIINNGKVEQYSFSRTQTNPINIRVKEGFWSLVVPKTAQTYENPTFEQVIKLINARVDSCVSRAEYDIIFDAIDKLIKPYEQLEQLTQELQTLKHLLPTKTTKSIEELVKEEVANVLTTFSSPDQELSVQIANEVVHRTKNMATVTQLQQLIKNNHSAVVTKQELSALMADTLKTLASKEFVELSLKKHNCLFATKEDVSTLINKANKFNVPKDVFTESLKNLKKDS